MYLVVFRSILSSDLLFLLANFQEQVLKWSTSKPVLESCLRETKDPMTKLNETLQNTSEVIKRLPEFPEIMDKANQALTYLASGQIPQNSNSYNALNTQKSEMIALRNQSIIGLLVLVIFGLLIF